MSDEPIALSYHRTDRAVPTAAVAWLVIAVAIPFITSEASPLLIFFGNSIVLGRPTVTGMFGSRLGMWTSGAKLIAGTATVAAAGLSTRTFRCGWVIAACAALLSAGLFEICTDVMSAVTVAPKLNGGVSLMLHYAWVAIRSGGIIAGPLIALIVLLKIGGSMARVQLL